MKIFVAHPKKPNSALRKIVKAKTPENKNVRAHIPGIGHKLMKFSSVLFRGCRVRDLPGIKYRVVRGAKGYNLSCVLNRVKGRSKYGTKKLNPYILKNIDLN
jgi:small subunit ribosomal protein S12